MMDFILLFIDYLKEFKFEFRNFFILISCILSLNS